MKSGPRPPDPELIDPDSFALSVALHEQFAMVAGTGVRDYARKHNLDPSTVSRSLSCTIVPTWDFIKELAWTAARDRYRRPPDGATLSQLNQLYMKVLASSNGKGHIVQSLRADLVKAQQEVLRHEETIARLSRELLEAQELNSSLSAQLRRLGLGLVQGGYTLGSSAVYRGGLYDEQTAVEDTIVDLTRQLSEERALRELAERRHKLLLLQFARNTEADDTEADDTEADDTEADDTEADDTEADDTEADDTDREEEANASEAELAELRREIQLQAEMIVILRAMLNDAHSHRRRVGGR